MITIFKLNRIVALIAVCVVAIMALMPRQISAGFIADGTWTQSGSPGTTTIVFELETGMAVGDYIRLTFPLEATINASGTDISMTGATSPTRSNLAVARSIDIITDAAIPAGTAMTITMTDALSSYDNTAYIRQSMAISHNTGSDDRIDTGAANINNGVSVVTAEVPALGFRQTGWFYDEETGDIISGGSVTVTGPGPINTVADGSTGYYEWDTIVTGGVYTLAVILPPNYAASAGCVVQSGDFAAASGGSAGTTLGSDHNVALNQLLSTDCTQFYYSFTVNDGDPPVLLNNIPLVREGLSDTGRAILATSAVGVVVATITAGLYIRQPARVRKSTARAGPKEGT